MSCPKPPSMHPSSSLLGLPYRVLSITPPKKELLYAFEGRLRPFIYWYSGIRGTGGFEALELAANRLQQGNLCHFIL